MRLSLTQFSIPELSLGASSKESDSFKTRIDYSKVPSQSIISHSMFVATWFCLEYRRGECVWLHCPRACDLLCIASQSFSATWSRSLGHVKCAAVFIWGCELLPFLISQVAGIKGMFLANKKMDNQVKTHITYNRGRDWRLLQAPSKDLRANSIHCVLVSICVHTSFYMRALPSKGGLDRSWLIPAAMRDRAQKEQCPSELSALRLLSWKVRHFGSVQ